ncbi:MAG TPA: ribonuclease III [Stenomitos sp.]
MRPVSDLVSLLGLPTGAEELFEQALTHSSLSDKPHYERLEFLGDAVLKLVVAEWIFQRYPGLPEGELTKILTRVVSDATLGAVARELDLGSFLRLGRAEAKSGGARKVGTLAASLEAVLAAIYLTHGRETVAAVIQRLWERELAAAAAAPGAENFKARLQEETQERFGTLPIYRVVGGEGPLHQYIFFVEVEVEGQILGHGRGASKKQAEQAAASEALTALKRTS